MRRRASCSDAVEEVAHLMIARTDITANAIYKFFPAQTDGDRTLMILSPDGKNVLETFIFGRQSDAPGLCLADYIAPRDSGRLDYVNFFITTIGTGIRALAEEWKNKGDYLRSHILQVLGARRRRGIRGIAARKNPRDVGYRRSGRHHEKGSLPGALSWQSLLAGLSRLPADGRSGADFPPARSGQQNVDVHLTEGYMMDPEASVSAIVIHHPDAKYFSLSPADIERLERELDTPPKKPPPADLAAQSTIAARTKSESRPSRSM